MLGTWHGAEVPTAHPLDGMLAASGWWGKQFRDAETVHPLLFPTSDGRALWPLNPALAFGGLGVATKVPGVKKRNFASTIAALRPVLAARGPKARLRTTRYRGVDTATMIYDQLPINDVFRKLDELRALAGGAKISIDVLPVSAENSKELDSLLATLEARMAQLSGHV